MKRAFLILFALLHPLRGEVVMPSIFGDHMVLQQGMTLPVWGKAAPGERVSVLIGSRSGSVTADAAGSCGVVDASGNAGQRIYRACGLP